MSSKATFLSFALCFLLGCFCIGVIEHNKKLKQQTFNIEQTYKAKIDSLNNENLFLVDEIDSLNFKIEEVKSDLQLARIRKIKLSNELSEVKPINDTIIKFVHLNSENDRIIRDLEKIVDLKDSIIFKKDCIIMNDSLQIATLKLNVTALSQENSTLVKQVNRERRKKTFWQCTTGVGAAAIIILLL